MSELLSVQEYKKKFGIKSDVTVRNHEQNGLIEVKRLGRRKYITNVLYNNSQK